jgi:hypothetical protein
MSESDLPELTSLDQIAEVIDSDADVYVRWSRGPGHDADGRSCDELTGVDLPGLSANSLAVEDWWGDRSLELWIARRLYDYRHLREQRGPGVKPWLFEGREVARGPDNEPLVICDRPIAWLSEDLVERATSIVDEQRGDWGTLSRS